MSARWYKFFALRPTATVVPLREILAMPLPKVTSNPFFSRADIDKRLYPRAGTYSTFFITRSFPLISTLISPLNGECSVPLPPTITLVVVVRYLMKWSRICVICEVAPESIVHATSSASPSSRSLAVSALPSMAITQASCSNSVFSGVGAIFPPGTILLRNPRFFDSPATSVLWPKHPFATFSERVLGRHSFLSWLATAILAHSWPSLSL